MMKKHHYCPMPALGNYPNTSVKGFTCLNSSIDFEEILQEGQASHTKLFEEQKGNCLMPAKKNNTNWKDLT